MKTLNLKCWLLGVFALLCAMPASATTTVTGKMQNLGTGNVSAGAFMRFWLRGCAGNQPRVNGTSLIAPSQGGVFYFDFAADSNGNISGTLYSTRDNTGNGNGDIECGGSLMAVWYGMQAFVNGRGGPEIPVHAKSGATLDITQVTPITTNPVVPSPTGDSTYARVDGGNQPFTGNVQAPSFSLGSSTSPKFTNSVASCCSGFAQVNTGLYAQSSLVTDGSVVENTNDAYYLFKDNNFLIFLQAGGPRGDGGLLANSTLTLPDINEHTASSQSGGLLGAKYTDVTASHIPVYGTSTLDTYVIDSGVTASGGNLGLSACTKFLNWTSGSFGGSLLCPGGGLSGNRVWVLPDAGGNVVIDSASQTLTNKTLTSPVVATGISNNGSGVKHARFGATCTTGAVGGNTCTTTYSWTTGFADANYTAVCWGEGPVGSPVLTLNAAQIAASITVQVQTIVSVASSFAGVDCIAVHD